MIGFGGTTTSFIGALTTIFMGLIKTATRAGETDEASAQILTEPPATSELTLLRPADPPEFLQLAQDGVGAALIKASIRAKPRYELMVRKFAICQKYRWLKITAETMHRANKNPAPFKRMRLGFLIGCGGRI